APARPRAVTRRAKACLALHGREGHAVRAERAVVRRPDRQGLLQQELEAEPVRPRELGTGLAVDGQRGDSDRRRPAREQVGMRALDRGAGADDVVDDRDPAAREDLAQRSGQAIADGEEGGAVALPEAGGVDERQNQALGDDEGDVGAFDERPADDLGGGRPQTLGELLGERSNAAGVEEEQLQVEPARAVVSRLEAEMPLAGREQLRELGCGIHGAEITVLRPVWYSL